MKQPFIPLLSFSRAFFFPPPILISRGGEQIDQERERKGSDEEEEEDAVGARDRSPRARQIPAASAPSPGRPSPVPIWWDPGRRSTGW